MPNPERTLPHFVMLGEAGYDQPAPLTERDSRRARRASRRKLVKNLALDNLSESLDHQVARQENLRRSRRNTGSTESESVPQPFVGFVDSLIPKRTSPFQKPANPPTPATTESVFSVVAEVRIKNAIQAAPLSARPAGNNRQE